MFQENTAKPARSTAAQNAAPRTAEAQSADVDEARWRAVKARDASADGSFYYAVASTGVFCRPSCAARLPRRENVSFHRTTAEAEAAGFRACKRCKPEQAPVSAWSHYFRVADIDAATAAVRAGGGTVMTGPMEVPGGDWIIQGTDPQGAFFALVGARKN